MKSNMVKFLGKPSPKIRNQLQIIKKRGRNETFLNLSTLGRGTSPTSTFSSPLESPIALDACRFVVLLNICMHHHVLTTINDFCNKLKTIIINTYCNNKKIC